MSKANYSNYDSIRSKVARQQTRSSLYIPKKMDLPFGLPLTLKIVDGDDIYIVFVTKLHTNVKYKTHFYTATAEMFTSIVEVEPQQSNNSGMTWSTSAWRNYFYPEIIQCIRTGRSLTQSIIGKYMSSVIDDAEYAKLTLTRDCEKVGRYD